MQSNLFKRLTASTTILIALFLIMTDGVIACARPLRDICLRYDFYAYDRNPVVEKLNKYLTAKHHPDVLLLGSSLLLVPAVYCDDAITGHAGRMLDSVTNFDFVAHYQQSVYLKRLLERQLGHSLQVDNLAVTGCMIADAYLILRRLAASGTAPRLVILGIAPRDFMDNQVPRLACTPTFQFLGSYLDAATLLKARLAPLQIVDYLLQQTWHVYKVRADYRTLAINWAAAVTSHPRSIYDSIAKTPGAINTAAPAKAFNDRSASTRPPGSAPPVNTAMAAEPKTIAGDLAGAVAHQPYTKHLLESDIQLYATHYNPPNASLFQQQSYFFQQMLKLARQSNINLIVVNMPLSAANKELIHPPVLKLYRNTVSDLTRQYTIKYIDLDSTISFKPNDFEDSCHMNESGGRKFYAALTSALKNDTSLRSLCADDKLIGQHLFH